VSVTESWIAGREAVRAFEGFCLEQKWIWHEVPGQADFGKDGYVDIVTQAGALTGSCFAVQIKGGRSRRRSGGYRIEATANNRSQWAASTLPVIGIVWDPDLSRLFWMDLTSELNEHGSDADLFVPPVQHLGSAQEIRRFHKYIGSIAHRQASILDLVSPDPEFQMAAIAACYHVGRSDGRALILLRRLLFSLDSHARRSAVWALASAVPHPDIFGTAESSPDRTASALLEPTLHWTIEEIVELLGLIGEDEGGIDRGTFGQHLYQLVVMDPAHRNKAGDAAIHGMRKGASTAAAWALILAISWAGENGSAELDRLLTIEPALGDTWSVESIRAMLEDFGYLSLF
jgi:hypothetical protein